MRVKNNKAEQADFWKGHSLSWKKSGLTQQAYCEQSGIIYRSFVYQHHRLSSQSKQSSIDFVEAKSTRTIRHQAVGGLQLLLPNGIRISISNEANLQLLKSVLALAGDVRC